MLKDDFQMIVRLHQYICDCTFVDLARMFTIARPHQWFDLTCGPKIVDSDVDADPMPVIQWEDGKAWR